MNEIDVSANTLQHHHWILQKIDGKELVVSVNAKAPTIEIGENMTANGHAGCNNYFGQGELRDGKFRIETMGMTRKMCPENSMKLEQAMTATLSDWTEISMTKETLTLSNNVHTLTFKLRDWVN